MNPPGSSPATPSGRARLTVRERSLDLAEDDVVRVLLDQHDRIRSLFSTLFTDDQREVRSRTFLELRTLLVVHETVEQLVLRPVSEPLTPPGLANRRSLEEKEATMLLAELEDMDVGCEEFDQRLAQLESVVMGHARAEEAEELGPVLEHCSDQDRKDLGRRVLAAERLAPTRPHPALAGSPERERTLGPVAALVDRIRDAVG